MKRRDILFLAGIILLGAIIRLLWITRVPPSLDWDEASVGYDAYSILQTGKDQWGQTFPVVFKSFGEFKYPVNVYFTALTTRLFGYGIFSVRVGSAIFGIIDILLLFFLVLRLTKSKTIAFLSTLFLAVSPWSIQFSRANWETNYGLFFFFLGVILFLKGLEKNKFWFIVSFAFLGLDLFTYNAAKVFVPLFVIAIVIIYFKGFIKSKVYVTLGLLIFLAFILINVINPNLSGLTRFGQVTITTRKTGVIQTVIENYFSHFTPQFLFISGDANPRHSIQTVGELYYYDLLLLPLGIFFLLRKRNNWSRLILAWFFLAPIPASIATEAPHAARSMFAIGGWQIVSAVGFFYLLTLIKKTDAKFLFMVFSSIVFILFTENYLIKYYRYYPIRYSGDWQYGYMKIFTDYKKDFSKYNKVVISDQDGQPYIFALYYLKYDPNSFRKTVIRSPEDFLGNYTVKSFGNFVFKTVEDSDLQKNTLVFASPNDKIDGISPVGEIKDLNGEVSFWVYSN